MQSNRIEKVLSESLSQRLMRCTREALPKAWKTSKWLLKIMIPVSFGVLLLDYSGGLAYISSVLNPLFQFIGLPGESAFVLLTSIFTNIYTAIAVIGSLGLDGRVVTILAVMCLVSHGFVIETAVLKKTGSSAIRMLLLRLLGSMVVGIFLNWALPNSPQKIAEVVPVRATDFSTQFFSWLYSTLYLTLKVIILVSSLMVLQKILDDFGVIRWLSRILSPLQKVMGLPEKTSFSWIVANTLGLAYGSAIMMEQVETGKMSRQEADLLNHHIAISHSNLEDPLLFAAIGVPIGWMILPRFVLGVVVVWLYRMELALWRKFNGRSDKYC